MNVFVVLLRFTDKRTEAGPHRAEHDAWIEDGMRAGVLLLVGSLLPARGGAVLAHGLTRAELEARVARDPFVAHGVVEAEIVEISPMRVAPAMAFLRE